MSKQIATVVAQLPEPINIEAWADAYIRLVIQRRQVACPTVATSPMPTGPGRGKIAV